MVSETEFVPLAQLRYEQGKIISAQTAMTVDNSLPAGDYLFQLEVKDDLRGDKRNIVAQFVQFDLIE